MVQFFLFIHVSHLQYCKLDRTWFNGEYKNNLVKLEYFLENDLLYFHPFFSFGEKLDVFFYIRVFFHRHWRFTGQQDKEGDHRLFHSTTSTRSRTLKHLFVTLHVRWLSRIFNRSACVYQTATRCGLPPYRITILIDWLMMPCLFVYLMNWF